MCSSNLLRHRLARGAGGHFGRAVVADVVTAALALVALALAQRVHHDDARAVRAGVRVGLEMALHARRQRRFDVALIDLEIAEPARQAVGD
jgi:hypothetical protein